MSRLGPGWGGAVLCCALAACNMNSGAGTRSNDGAATGTGGDTAASTDGPPIMVDAGALRPGTVRLAVPAYWRPDADWQKLIAAAPTVGMIIFDPASGPGTATDAAYTSAIAQAQQADIIVLGYVSTQYGQRALADIEADIDTYYSLYTPSGIYLAEGPMEADCTNMDPVYRMLVARAQSHDPKAFIAIGTKFCPTFIEFSDVMVEFAEDWTTFQSYTVPDWMPANSPTRFVQFVNSVTADNASKALQLQVGYGAGWVFATDGTQPNPWGALPSYWDQELAALRALQ